MIVNQAQAQRIRLDQLALAKRESKIDLICSRLRTSRPQLVASGDWQTLEIFTPEYPYYICGVCVCCNKINYDISRSVRCRSCYRYRTCIACAIKFRQWFPEFIYNRCNHHICGNCILCTVWYHWANRQRGFRELYIGLSHAVRIWNQVESQYYQ